MQLFKALMLSAVLLMTPTAALADWNFGGFGGWFTKIIEYFREHRFDYHGDNDDHQSPIPEPSGALVMGAGLAVAALAMRRNRK